MLKDPAMDPEILETLSELRMWLDGFLCDRESDGPEGEIWPRAITGHHLDALETVIDFSNEKQNNAQLLDELNELQKKEIESNAK